MTKRPVKCQYCEGTGKVHDLMGFVQKCPTCKGVGKVRI